jgi:hypothetical protein
MFDLVQATARHARSVLCASVSFSQLNDYNTARCLAAPLSSYRTEHNHTW